MCEFQFLFSSIFCTLTIFLVLNLIIFVYFLLLNSFYLLNIFCKQKDVIEFKKTNNQEPRNSFYPQYTFLDSSCDTKYEFVFYYYYYIYKENFHPKFICLCYHRNDLFFIFKLFSKCSR